MPTKAPTHRLRLPPASEADGLTEEAVSIALERSRASVLARLSKEDRERICVPAREGDELYSSRRWRRLRANFLTMHPLCSDPFGLHRGRTVAATEVDHVIPRRERGDLQWREENLEGLCHECHSRKTGYGQ